MEDEKGYFLKDFEKTVYKCFGIFGGLYIPKGCAHGFMSLCDNTVVSYKCIGKYEREADTGIIWNDPDLGIEWPLEGEPIVSERDQTLMSFKEFVNKFGEF